MNVRYRQRRAHYGYIVGESGEGRGEGIGVGFLEQHRCTYRAWLSVAAYEWLIFVDVVVVVVFFEALHSAHSATWLSCS